MRELALSGLTSPSSVTGRIVRCHSGGGDVLLRLEARYAARRGTSPCARGYHTII